MAAQERAVALPQDFGRASLFLDDRDNIDGCHVQDLPSAREVGFIPGGGYGTWWSPSEFRCKPCGDYGIPDALCNRTYPECERRCLAGGSPPRAPPAGPRPTRPRPPSQPGWTTVPIAD